MFYGAKAEIFQYALELRQNMTKAEKALWNRLNKNQLGVRFKAQHPINIFIADFYCHKHKLVIEVDGDIHKKQKEYDEGRTFELEHFGIEVIRFTNEEIFHNIEEVIRKIETTLSLTAPKSPKGDLQSVLT